MSNIIPGHLMLLTYLMLQWPHTFARAKMQPSMVDFFCRVGVIFTLTKVKQKSFQRQRHYLYFIYYRHEFLSYHAHVPFFEIIQS